MGLIPHLSQVMLLCTTSLSCKKEQSLFCVVTAEQLGGGVPSCSRGLSFLAPLRLLCRKLSRQEEDKAGRGCMCVT